MNPTGYIHSAKQRAEEAHTAPRPEVEVGGWPALLRIGQVAAAQGSCWQVTVLADDGSTLATLNYVRCVPTATLEIGALVWLVQLPNTEPVIMASSGGTASSALDNAGMVTE